MVSRARKSNALRDWHRISTAVHVDVKQVTKLVRMNYEFQRLSRRREKERALEDDRGMGHRITNGRYAGLLRNIDTEAVASAVAELSDGGGRELAR